MQISYTLSASKQKNDIIKKYLGLKEEIESLENVIKKNPSIIKSNLGSVYLYEKFGPFDIFYRTNPVLLSSKMILPDILRIYFIVHKDDILVIDIFLDADLDYTNIIEFKIDYLL